MQGVALSFADVPNIRDLQGVGAFYQPASNSEQNSPATIVGLFLFPKRGIDKASSMVYNFSVCVVRRRILFGER